MDHIPIASNHKLVVKLAPCKLLGMNRSSSNKCLQAHDRRRCIRTRVDQHNSIKLPKLFQPMRGQLKKHYSVTTNAQPKPLVKLPFPSLKQVKTRLKLQENMTFGQKIFKIKGTQFGCYAYRKTQIDDVTPRFGGDRLYIA